MRLEEELKRECGKEISQCDNHELYEGLLALVQQEAAKRERRKSIISRQSF